MLCPKCKRTTPDYSNFCGWCGQQIKAISAKDKYIIRLRRAITIMLIVLVLTWGYIAYLNWIINGQREHIDALTAALGAHNNSGGNSSEDEATAWV